MLGELGFAAIAALLTVPAAISDELVHLEDLQGNPVVLIDAVRRFDLQQKDLIRWDQEMMADYSRRGQSESIERKQADILHRVALMEEAWLYVLARYPNSARANNYYGEVLYDYTSNQMEAIKRWRIAVRQDKKLAPAHNNLGLHYFHGGDYRRGLQYLQEALKLDKDNPDFLFNMAQMYLVHFPQIGKLLKVPKEKLYRQAMAMSKKAAEFASDDYDFLEDYAVNFYAAENFKVEVDWKDAAEAWQAARAKARTPGEIFYSLLNEGRTWIRAGESEKALVPLQTALQMRPHDRVAEQLIAKAKGEES